MRDFDAGLARFGRTSRRPDRSFWTLLSRAIKLTPESGRIEVRAVPMDGLE